MKDKEELWICDLCGYEDYYNKKQMKDTNEMECVFCRDGKMKRDGDIE